MLFKDEANIIIRNLKTETQTERTIVVFYAENKKSKYPMMLSDVINIIKENLKENPEILQLSVAEVKTTVCQNNCSGMIN